MKQQASVEAIMASMDDTSMDISARGTTRFELTLSTCAVVVTQNTKAVQMLGVERAPVVPLRRDANTCAAGNQTPE
jgi:hypothetical protein